MSNWAKKFGLGKGKGPLIRPPADPVEETTAEREGRTHNRNVTSSKRRGERTGAFVPPRTMIEEETETEAEQEMDAPMDAYMHPQEYEYDPQLRFQQKYQFSVPDFPSDDDYEDVPTPTPPPVPMGGTFGGSNPVSRSRTAPRKKLPSRPWMLTGETPGGPKYAHLIPSFGGRHMVKLRSHAKCTWPGPDDDDFVSLLESTDLYHLRDCSLPQHNNPLIEAFIERWQPDTNSFHMPFGEMTITLHDVHFIMGFRVSGIRPNVWMDKADAIQLGARAFGVDPALMEQWWYGGGPRLDDLEVKYADNSTFPSAYRVRAYIAYLLGKLLFVDKSGSKVRADFFPLLEEINLIREYSWGSATLAYLYRQLGMTTQAEAAQIAGY
ncbi:PREDICTED: uncharacterized protein LOC105960128 [Erythranthe guttata]|uniref:uncharacterized protein LOC105960128 n=1 Tax=Erythranthe guttata TaxID=4155 RepID=UPI00064DE08D|nr:PREDICTED: uncharacterized protein LOC105960128 [Erythranthe guttata]|eukprot:XP_012839755.1 PREDICTED: uncharacterized protein LOC105960128 [Erythranthe guttata]